MDLILRITIVPIFTKTKIVYLMVDIYRVLIFLLFISFIPFSASAQLEKEIDSLQQVIKTTENDSIKANAQLTLAETIVYQDPALAKSYIDSAESIYKIKSYERGLANLFAMKANYYYTQSAYDSSMVYLERSGDEFMKIGDTIFGATIKSNLTILVSLISDDLSRYEGLVDEIEPVAIRYRDSSLMASMLEHRSTIALKRGFRNISIQKMLETIELREQFKDSFYLPQAYYKVGSLYQEIFEHEKAIEQFDMGIQISEQVGQKNMIAQLYRIKAMSQMELDQLDKAETNLNLALETSKEINLRRNLTSTLIQLGQLEINRDNLVEAAKYLNAAAKEEDQMITTVLYNYNMTLGELNLKRNKPLDALENFNKCLEIAESNESFRNISWSKLHRSKALKQLGKLNEAYNELQESSDAKDSLNNYMRTELAQEQKIIFETNRKEKEIALQKSQIELLEEQKKVAKSRQLLLIIGIIFIVLLGVLLLYGIRQKMKRNKIEREKLDASLEFKEKELTTHALHLAHKNEVLLDLKSQLKELKSNSDNGRHYQKVINTINLDINNDNNWEQFRSYFEDVHKGFNSKVKKQYPEVSPNDLRLMALLKMNLSSKEIANILNISTEGVKKARYRLRKKLNLSTEDSLQELVIEL